MKLVESPNEVPALVTSAGAVMASGADTHALAWSQKLFGAPQLVPSGAGAGIELPSTGLQTGTTQSVVTLSTKVFWGRVTMPVAGSQASTVPLSLSGVQSGVWIGVPLLLHQAAVQALVSSL